MGNDFPFSIVDVASLLSVQNKKSKAQSIDSNCPFCFKIRKFNMNIISNVYRCNYCGASGGMLDLYMQFHPDISNRSEAYHAIREALSVGYSNGYTQTQKRTEIRSIPQSTIAMPWELHKTYSFLFSLLSLSPKHKQDLLRRGLTEEQIERYGYKSTPAYGFVNLANKIIDSGCKVEGIPGFYFDDKGQWTIRFHSKSTGIIIPVLSSSGQIQGAQIRLDNPFEGRKYIWLSSAEKPKGVSSGSPVHFAGSTNVKTICVTEGGLKGTIAHCLTGWTFACLAGAGQYASFSKFIPALKSNGVEEIAVAYDMDLYTNKQVMKHCLAILCAARDAGLSARVMKWNPINNGVDDHYWAKELKQLLLVKMECELHKRGSTSADTELYNCFRTGIQKNGVSSKVLAFLYYQELPLGYLIWKFANSPNISFMEMIAAIEQEIPKSF